MTAHSHSIPLISSSTTTFLSCEKANFMPALSSSRSCAFEMPTDDPQFAGLTYIGYPSFFSISSHFSSSCESSEIMVDTHLAVLMPWLSSIVWVTSLSIQSADEIRSQPTNGISAIWKIPCIVPSSPFLP